MYREHRLRYSKSLLVALWLVTLNVLGAMSALNILPRVYTQTTTYSMELYNARWTMKTIAVKVPSTPGWASREVLDAMQTWNQAQTWFRDTYNPSGSIYALTASTNGPVTVQFHNLSVASSSQGLYTVGTVYPNIAGRTILGARMELTLYLAGKQTTPYSLYLVAVHEFGHVLGIRHTDVDTDIMYEELSGKNANLPSTLDLHSISYMASGSASEVVTLPSNIPYEFVPESAVPEFPMSQVLLLSAFVLACLYVRKAVRRPPNRPQ